MAALQTQQQCRMQCPVGALETTEASVTVFYPFATVSCSDRAVSYLARGALLRSQPVLRDPCWLSCLQASGSGLCVCVCPLLPNLVPPGAMPCQPPNSAPSPRLSGGITMRPPCGPRWRSKEWGPPHLQVLRTHVPLYRCALHTLSIPCSVPCIAILKNRWRRHRQMMGGSNAVASS